MIAVTDKHKCCGCSACIQRCPKQCITMLQDSEGFFYPQVDKTTCTDCGLCERNCPVLHPYEKREPLYAYAAINKNDEIRMQSSSGGIFTLLAERIIEEGGVVFGARFDEDWQVTLDYTETKEGLAAFRGSKYVQARTADTYVQCEKFLKEGRKVMYSGTPCQIAGLKHFLKKDYENLLTVDFVCHGTPSPKVWDKYLKEIVGSVSDISKVAMRDKSRGWEIFSFVMTYNKEDETITLSTPFTKNDFMNAFLKDMILRPSCYQCAAKECRSNSDITIADYWGISSVAPEMNDDKGTGLVLLHTDKGESYFNHTDVKIKETTFEEAYRHNPAIYRSARPWYNRENFFNELDSCDSVSELIREKLKPSPKMRFRRRLATIKALPKHIVKKLIASLMGGGTIDRNR